MSGTNRTQASITQFLRDMLETGDEIEALRIAAQRLGKAEPPKKQAQADQARAGTASMTED